MRAKRILSLFDAHVPKHINLIPVFKFAYDFKPDVIVLGGDMGDFETASHWIANQSIELDGKSLKKDFEQLHEIILEPLRPLKALMEYLEGNHEDWLEQTILLNRNGLGYWELENNIDLKKYKMELIKVNGSYMPCPNLVYIHGCYTNEFHARKTVQAYHNSVIYGHTHTMQRHMEISPVDGSKFYKGESVGCLTTLNPHYLKNKPNKHVNGFNFCYVNEDTGFFNDFSVVIVEGSFWANGKFYK